MCEALVTGPVERSLLNASLGERPQPHLERCHADDEHEPRHSKENQGPENPAGAEDRVPSDDRCGDAASDNDDDPRDGEEAIASNDAINGMGQETWVARASGVRVPKQARGNVPKEGDDRGEVEKFEQEVQGRMPGPVCLTKCAEAAAR